MSCRSCGLGPIKIRASTSKVKNTVVSSPPAKGVINSTKKKTSVPTRSPARTFKNVNE